MTFNPKKWPLVVHVSVLAIMMIGGYAIQRLVEDPVDSMIQLGGGVVILVLGVNLADRLMSRPRNDH